MVLENDEYYGLDKDLIGDGTTDSNTRTLSSHIERQLNQNAEYLTKRGWSVSYSPYTDRTSHNGASDLQTAGRIFSKVHTSMEHDPETNEDLGIVRFAIPVWVTPLTKSYTVRMFGRVLPPSASVDGGNTLWPGTSKVDSGIFDEFSRVQTSLQLRIPPMTPWNRAVGTIFSVSNEEDWYTNIDAVFGGSSSDSDKKVLPDEYSNTLEVPRSLVESGGGVFQATLVFAFECLGFEAPNTNQNTWSSTWFGVENAARNIAYELLDYNGIGAVDSDGNTTTFDLLFDDADVKVNNYFLGAEGNFRGEPAFKRMEESEGPDYAVVDDFRASATGTEKVPIRGTFYSSALQPISWSFEETLENSRDVSISENRGYIEKEDSTMDAEKVVEGEHVIEHAKNIDNTYFYPRLQAIGPRPRKAPSGDINEATGWPSNYNAVWRYSKFTDNTQDYGGNEYVNPDSILDEQSIMLDKGSGTTLQVQFHYLIIDLNQDLVSDSIRDHITDIDPATAHRTFIYWFNEFGDADQQQQPRDNKLIQAAYADVDINMAVWQRPFDITSDTPLHEKSLNLDEHHIHESHPVNAYPVIKNLSASWMTGTLQQDHEQTSENYHFDEGLLHDRDFEYIRSNEIHVDIDDNSADFSRPFNVMLFLDGFSNLTKYPEDWSFNIASPEDRMFVYCFQTSWHETGAITLG